MRLSTRDPAFPLAVDEYSKPVLWQQIAQCEQVDFFELPEARALPLRQETVQSLIRAVTKYPLGNAGVNTPTQVGGMYTNTQISDR